MSVQLPPLRVLLVDDSREFLESATHFIAMLPPLSVVGAVTSGDEALAQCALLQPDLVLLDWSMPGMSGLQAARSLKSRPNPPWVLILTFHDGPLYKEAARLAGADGLVTKSRWTSELAPVLAQLTVGSESHHT